MRRFFNTDLSVGLVCAKFLVALFLLVVFISSADAREVTLQWDPNSEPDLSHYVVHWSTSSRSYTNSSGDIGLDTSYACTLPDDGQIYYFAVTAVDEAGLESDYSNEVDTGDVPGNSAPIAIAGPDQNVNEGSLVYLDASNSNDPDGDAISYQWTQISGISVALDNPVAIQPSFTAPSISSQGESLTFQLTVTDSEGLQSTDSCIVNIVSVNNPPAADAGPDLNINEGSLVYLDGTNSSDPDGDALTYQWIQTGGLSVSLNGLTSAQPTFDSPYISSEGESLTFQLTVTDSEGLQSTDSCVVNIISVNNPPEADAGPDQNVNEGSIVYLNGSNSSDPDGDALTYQWTQASGPAVTLDNSSAVQPSFNSPYIESEGESITFQLTVTDEGSLQSTDTCIVNIVSVNNPPSASAGPDQTVDEGALVTLNGSGSSDPDGDVLTFKWIQTGGTSVTLSSSIEANPVFEAFFVDPEGESLTFKLTVTDIHGLQSTDTCIVNIAWVNDPPVADAGPDQDVDEGSSVTLNGSGSSDPEGDSLTYKWTQVSGPAVTFNDSKIVNPAFDIPYIDTDGESMTFQLTVTDEGGLQSSDTCIVNIVSVNNPPSADAGADQSVDEETVVTLSGSGSSDPDGDELTYKWTQASGPVVTLNNSGTIQANFITPDVNMEGASLVFQLTVTDEGGLKSTDICTVNVSWVNEAPTAKAGSDLTVDEGTTVTLNGSGSSDPDGSTLTYEWTQVSGPAVTLNNSGSAIAAFTSPDVNMGGVSLVFQLTVTDEGNLESTDTCTVNVSWVNEAPTASAGSDQTVDEETAVTLNGSGSSDPDGNALTYEWTQVSGPVVTLNNSNSVIATFTSPDVNTEGASLVF
ncbi:MAG: PKD domain-containing protein, partial [Desulfobacteraceae bacterium]